MRRITIAALVVAALAAVAVAGLASLSRLAESVTRPPAGPATLEEDGFAFDHPPGWTVSRPRTDAMFASSLIFVGTGAIGEACRFFENGAECTSLPFVLEPGDVVVSVGTFGGPPSPWTVLDRPLEGGRREVVGGMPAIRWDRGPLGQVRADRVVAWEVAVPGSLHATYDIAIHAREPGAAASIASGEALVRSFRFRPPVEPLRPDPIVAVDVATRAIRHLAREQRDFACFPALPGGTARGMLHREPLGPKLQRPLGVECRTDVNATPLHLWRVDLTFGWAAGPTYPAGRTVTTVWVDVDGAILGAQAGSGDPVPIAIVAPDGGT